MFEKTNAIAILMGACFDCDKDDYYYQPNFEHVNFLNFQLHLKALYF